MLSCVFDLDGLWEVLADLDRPADSGSGEERRKEDEEERETVQEEGNANEGGEDRTMVDEIGDSQEDDDDELPLPAPQPRLQPQSKPQPKPETPSLPDIIIITHFSSLLTSLFTHREKAAAHSALQLLGTHLRDLTRNLASSPLVLLLNSTSSAAPSPADGGSGAAKKAAPDPTLRSIFNPPPPPGYAAHAGAPAATRRSKPSFGLVFAQLLDLHLLCTRIPRGRDDAEAAAAAFHHRHDGGAALVAGVSTVWVVEVLLDDMGVWEGRKGARRDREQRWTAVDVEGARVKEAFLERERERVVGEVRLAGGFGGRRV